MPCTYSNCNDIYSVCAFEQNKWWIDDDDWRNKVYVYYYSVVNVFFTRHSRSELARYLFYCMFFRLFFLFGQRFLSKPRADSRQILHAGVAWVGTCLLPFWGSGGKRGEMKFGSSHSWIGQLTFLFTWALPNVVGYVGHTPAHILVWNRKKSSKGFLQGGPKNRKSQFFSIILRLYVHISQQRLKIEAYKLVQKQALSLPYRTVACAWTHRSHGSTGWAKMSDAIPVFSISPIVLLSVSSPRLEVRSNM